MLLHLFDQTFDVLNLSYVGWDTDGFAWEVSLLRELVESVYGLVNAFLATGFAG